MKKQKRSLCYAEDFILCFLKSWSTNWTLFYHEWGVGRKWIKGESKSPYKYQDSESLRIEFRVSFEKSTETGDVRPRGFNSFSNLSP